MRVVRIGNKTIDKESIYETINHILDLRCGGWSQQEVADKVKVDRSFVSRLESIGEIRRGGSIAFIAFPVKNKDEILKLLERYGVEFHLVMSEEERLAFVQQRTGVELTNSIMELIATARRYYTVVVFTSDKRSKLIDALVDGRVIKRNIGKSPLTGDVYVSPEEIIEVLDTIRGAEEE
jgi:transcriptional regulator with XRE-family HTH domain